MGNRQKFCIQGKELTIILMNIDVEIEEDELMEEITRGGELACRFREVEEQQGRQTGKRIVDILHKADPWQGMDCGRDKRLQCKRKQRTGKLLQQDCTKHGV